MIPKFSDFVNESAEGADPTVTRTRAQWKRDAAYALTNAAYENGKAISALEGSVNGMDWDSRRTERSELAAEIRAMKNRLNEIKKKVEGYDINE